MCPSPKKRGPLVLLPSDECQWDLMQGDIDGAPIIVRRNASIVSVKSHPELSIKIGFAIPLLRPNKGGMPDSQENKSLQEIEDIIETEVLKDHTAVFAMAITTGEFKEFIYYAKVGGDIGATHGRITEIVSQYDVQCMAEEDPEWTAYDMF